ncbi:MAG: UDP-N-acetylmuramoyl-L-alanine--D-glutamate ligase [Chloroflexi bacterium]|nr:UDP-N-acetylmuramoyl-L-alanine--D-glutamate ligase [Chloroflexota bacterium]
MPQTTTPTPLKTPPAKGATRARRPVATALVVGLAREGGAAARWLAEQGLRVIISDVRPAQALANSIAQLEGLDVELRLGPQTPALLEGVDMVVASPGAPQDMPLFRAARERGMLITTEPRLFAQQCPAPIIGITGSSGKTTTATLTARMLEAAGFKTWLGGNIGAPLLRHLTDIASEDRVVMELSSFQLYYWSERKARPLPGMTWTDTRGLSPDVAAVLNLTPNHLDRHPSMSHYIAAKTHILAHQTQDSVAVLNRDDPITARWAREKWVSVDPGRGQEAVRFPLAGQVMTFGLETQPEHDGAWVAENRVWLRRKGETAPVAAVSDIRLRGRHNLANVLAACCLAAAAGAATEAMREAISTFEGAPHRLEMVAVIDGVQWINDSIATSPERSLAALRSFEQPIILLAGGRDKHLPWKDWAQEVHVRVRRVIAFGEAAPLIQTALADAPVVSRLEHVHVVSDLAEAVALAHRLARPGEVALLSPGGTSFDAYEDFAQRGRHFRELVHTIAQRCI